MGKRIVLVLFSVLTLVLVGCSGEADADNAELDGKREAFQEKADEIIKASDGVVVDIYLGGKVKDGRQVKIIVDSDTWYSAPEEDKQTFADTVGEKVRHAVWDSELQEQGYNLVAHLYDEDEKKVASYKLTSKEYKILR